MSFNLFAQDETPQLPISNETHRITYAEVIQVDSTITKANLFFKGREWFAKAYKSSTSVIQMEDKEAGKIVGKALMTVYHKALGSNVESGNISYTISLSFKDGRYKYEVTDFVHTSNYESGRRRKTCEDMMAETRKMYKRFDDYYLYQLDLNVKALISDLKNTMRSKSSITKNDDW